MLKNLKPGQLSLLFNKETDDFASPSDYQQNGHRSTHILFTHTFVLVMDNYWSLATLDRWHCFAVGITSTQASLRLKHPFDVELKCNLRL